MIETWGIKKDRNSMAGFSAFAEHENGGKGSGNFGHAGRPGKRGSSASSGSSHAIDAEGYTSSTKEIERLIPEGDNFYADGERFTVERGEHGLMGVSKDGKRVVAHPAEILDGTAQYMDKGENPAKRLDAFHEIASKLGQYGAPRMVVEEISRYAAKEHDLFGSDKDKTKTKKELDSYAETARGAIKAYADGNGGTSKKVSEGMRRWLKAVSEQIEFGQASATDILKREATHNELEARIEKLERILNGGSGSGNFGHSGRPGKVGGSSASGSSRKGDDGYFDKDGFHSRYEDKKTFEYDGDTFIVDDDKRGGTTKDGKRSMMFPDEILLAQGQMLEDYKAAAKTKDGLSPSQYSHATMLALGLQRKVDKKVWSDKRDQKEAERIVKELRDIVDDPRQQSRSDKPESV